MGEAEKKMRIPPSAQKRCRPSLLRCVGDLPLINCLPESKRATLLPMFPKELGDGLFSTLPPKKTRKPPTNNGKKNKKRRPPKAPAAGKHQKPAVEGSISTFLSSSVRAKMDSINNIDQNYELCIAPIGPKNYATNYPKNMAPITPAKPPLDDRASFAEKRQLISTPNMYANLEELKRAPKYIEHTSFIEPNPDDPVAALQDHSLVKEVFPDGNLPAALPSPSIVPAATTPSDGQQSMRNGQDSRSHFSKLASFRLDDDEKPMQAPPSAEILRLRSGRTIDRSLRKKQAISNVSAVSTHASEQPVKKAESSKPVETSSTVMAAETEEDKDQFQEAQADLSPHGSKQESSVQRSLLKPGEEIVQEDRSSILSDTDLFEDTTDLENGGDEPILEMDEEREHCDEKDLTSETNGEEHSDEKDGTDGTTDEDNEADDEEETDEYEDENESIEDEDEVEAEEDEGAEEEEVDDENQSESSSEEADDEDESFASAKSDMSSNGLQIRRLSKAMARLSMLPSRQSIAFNFEHEVYRACGQSGPVAWEKAFSEQLLSRCVKIGEGTYGEVFRSVNDDGQSVVLKVIPIEGDTEYNGAVQMPFGEVFPEIYISVALSQLRKGKRGNATPNFVDVKGVRCVKGRYPQKLLDAWDVFDQQKQSENDPPGDFDENQLFIVFIFGDGGCDLENVKLKTVKQAESIIKQIALTLAVAEIELQFEHRDLHHGNILVKETTEDEIGYLIDGKRIQVESHGVHVFIIDFTISRCHNTTSGQPLYSNLALDPVLFQGEGDYQFDIYRKMRDFNKNEWQTFHPKTNVFWLDYVIDKLTTAKKYAGNRRMTPKQVTPFNDLRADLERFCSCRELISSQSFFQVTP